MLAAMLAVSALEPHPSLGDERPVWGAAAIDGTIAGEIPKAPIVVFLEGARQPGRKPASHRLGQKGLRFTPDFLLVAQGDTVSFPNDDRVTHNVFSISRAKRFDLDLYPPGSSREILFDEAGQVDVFCSIHQNMHAVIVVVPSDYAAVAGADGAFRMPAVPPGRYTAVAWLKGKEIARQPVVVEPGKDASLAITPKPPN